MPVLFQSTKKQNEAIEKVTLHVYSLLGSLVSMMCTDPSSEAVRMIWGEEGWAATQYTTSLWGNTPRERPLGGRGNKRTAGVSLECAWDCNVGLKFGGVLNS